MSDSSAFGFGKFIPGFEFLQSLGKAGQSPAATPPLSHWVAPTMRIEDIEKRIEELKAVQFWLEQNSKALAATVQALEVQKMTLSTLQSMNVNFSEMAKAFPFASAGAATESAANEHFANWPLSAGARQAQQDAPAQPTQEPTPPKPEAVKPEPQEEAPQATQEASSTAQAASMAAATQWWNALTQQFQQIAQQAMQDPAQQQAMAQATKMTTDFAQTAVKAATEMVKQAVNPKPAAAAPKKPAAGKKASTAKSATTAATKTQAAAASKRSAANRSASADKKATSARAKPHPRSAKQSVARKTPAR